ncbi:MAG: helix-turn-helix domain-containing protein [Pseudomonadales bacterium]|jgi:AcrR family transcriptional regulator|nr:helix-turn-helix domain-containing protein [Pseudomonadales bacterium]
MTTPAPTPDAPADTRTRLLDAAEHLFARDGFAGTSTRAILQAADQRNESALQYHFGGRNGLVAAIHARRIEQIEALRRPRLEALLAEPGPLAVRDLARVQFGAMAELAGADPGFVDYLRALGELATLPRAAFAEFIARLDIAPEGTTARRRVAHAFGHLPPATRRRRLELARRFAFTSLSHWAREEGAFTGRSARAFVDDLAQMVDAMITAPTSEG